MRVEVGKPQVVGDFLVLVVRLRDQQVGVRPSAGYTRAVQATGRRLMPRWKLERRYDGAAA
jgi:hypothetical protein